MSAQAAIRTDEQEKAYDEVPYESFTYGQTHPQHMAMIGSLFGLNVPDIKTAHVLELGCAAGMNLFPLALTYPKAKFTGIDLSQEQIKFADTHKEALGLKNITFNKDDILTFDLKKNKDKFDYIICHGVYSWVPENVSERILELCRECLSDNGLALISYNTLPGWNAVRSLREMMLFHTSRFNNPNEKVSEARKLLNFLAENVSDGRSAYKGLIEDERKLLQSVNDSYLYHDHLENTNHQYYFHQFAEAAHKYDLNYVGDSSLVTMFVGNMPQKALETLKAVNNIVLQEQYMDFVTNRRFRTSIITKKQNTPNRALRNEQIMDYCLTANMKTEEDKPDLTKPVKFVKNGGGYFTTNAETSSTLFAELVASGNRPIAARDLAARVQKKLKLKTSDEIEAILVQHGLQFALRGFINLHTDSPSFVSEVSEKPEVFALARLQAAQPNCKAVTNALCGMIPSDMIANLLMQQMDGKKTLEDITDYLVSQAAAKKITIRKDGQPVTDKEIMREQAANVVRDLTGKLAKQALLVA